MTVSSFSKPVMRKIVVPTDFSENAFNALKYACQIFKYERGDIFILHAYADEVYQQDQVVKRNILEELKEVTYQKSQEALRETLTAIQEYSPNPQHRFRIISAFGTMS